MKMFLTYDELVDDVTIVFFRHITAEAAERHPLTISILLYLVCLNPSGTSAIHYIVKDFQTPA